MAIPTAAQVYGDVRGILGDLEVAGGDLFTDAFLLQYLQRAVNLMFRALSFAESPVLYRKNYVLLAANQRYVDFDAATAAMPDFAEMRAIRSRGVSDSGDITALVWNAGTSAWRATSAAHGRTSGQTVFVQGVTTGPDELINTDWPIAVIDANTFDLTGSPNKTAVTSTYSGSGGSWIFPSDSDWSDPYDEVEGIRDTQDGRVATRYSYALREGALRLEGTTAARLLEINYRMSPDNIVSLAPNLRIRNSRDALAQLTAAFAGDAVGSEAAGAALVMALGPNPDPGSGRNPGGLLGDLVQQHATMSRQPVHTLRMRPHRGRVRGWPGW